MDSEDKCLDTVRKIVDLKPQFARIYPSLVIKDTYMEHMYRIGEYNPLELNKAVEICKKMLIFLESNYINVIRIGLQPTDEMRIGKNIVAGPYHPSFRQLVESEIYKDMINSILDSVLTNPYANISISFNFSDYSNIIGQKKSNVKYFNDKHPNATFSFVNGDINKGSVCVKIDEHLYNLSKKEYYENIKACCNKM